MIKKALKNLDSTTIYQMQQALKPNVPVRIEHQKIYECGTSEIDSNPPHAACPLLEHPELNRLRNTKTRCKLAPALQLLAASRSQRAGVRDPELQLEHYGVPSGASVAADPEIQLEHYGGPSGASVAADPVLQLELMNETLHLYEVPACVLQAWCTIWAG